MRSDLSNFLMGQEDFTKNNIQVGTPVLPPERSYALAAARSLQTTGAGDHNKMNIIGQPKVNSFGAKVYQNCLIFENISQQPAEEKAVVFFQDLIWSRKGILCVAVPTTIAVNGIFSAENDKKNSTSKVSAHSLIYLLLFSS